MTNCLICDDSLDFGLTLSIGPLVACNQFQKKKPALEHTHPLRITECAACNLVQLSKYPLEDFVRPRLPWIRYSEPAGHLGFAADKLKLLFPENKVHLAIGVGPFDEPLLELIAQFGFIRIQLELFPLLPRDSASYPYLESIQALLRPDVLKKMASTQGAADLVLCRYLIEHSHDPLASLEGLSHLINDDGLLLIEVPDSSKFINKMDYSFIWEEHISYFTEETFHACANRAGYKIIQFTRYPGDLEDALVFVLRKVGKSVTKKPVNLVRKNSESFTRYQSGFEKVRQKLHSTLSSILRRGRKIAIFGAGHQSIMFINAFGLSEYISYAVDDSPEKKGYLLPGTSIPIVPSEKLILDTSIDVCLLGVGPKIEAVVRKKCARYLNRGGEMYTIFPGAGGSTILDYAPGTKCV